jgi:hypothetical protein
MAVFLKAVRISYGQIAFIIDTRAQGDSPVKVSKPVICSPLGCRFISEESTESRWIYIGLFKFIASFNLQRFLRSSTLPRYYPFGLSKSWNNSSLINLQHRGKPASGKIPYVISTSWLFRRINPPTPELEPSTFQTCSVEERQYLFR